MSGHKTISQLGGTSGRLEREANADDHQLVRTCVRACVQPLTTYRDEDAPHKKLSSPPDLISFLHRPSLVLCPSLSLPLSLPG